MNFEHKKVVEEFPVKFLYDEISDVLDEYEDSPLVHLSSFYVGK